MATYTPEQWRRMLKLDELEDRENLPRGTLTAVMRAESGGKSTVVSPAGAGGLFQLMPATAASYKADRFNPEQSADAAAKELGSHYKRYGGDLQQTLAAWNWGSGNLQKHGMANAPAETKGFIPRVLKWLGPGTAEASERAGQSGRTGAGAPVSSKWYDVMPDKPPSAAAPPQESGGTAPLTQQPTPAAARSQWYDVMPEKPPASPLPASPGAPAQAPLPGAPPAASAAPAPMQRPLPPTATSTPEQDAAYRVSVGQEPGAAPTQDAPALSGPATTVTPESQQAAQGIQGAEVAVDPAELSKRWDEGGATSTDPAWWSGADPASPRHQEWLKTSPMPPLRDVAREVAATGVEGAYGVLGTAAGGAVGGVPGAVAGGIAGQSLGRRVTNATGLREQEPYLATGFGLNLYPSDVANAGFGLLTGGPALFKAALAKTTAGKAIVEAEMTTKQAYQAWQIERQRLQAAQKTGQQAELNTALKEHATAEANYKRLVGERNETIAANKAEYDQAVKDYGEGARQTHIEDLTAQQKYLDDLAEAQRKQYGVARADTERELLASREAGYNKTLDQIKKEQGTYETAVGAETTALESQKAAIPEARAIPEPYAQGTPSHVLYKDMRDRYSNEPLTLTQGQADLKDLRANRPKTLAGTPSPFEGEVETIAQGLEKATGANVATIHEQLKKLGPLTRHKDGKIRGDAKQLTSILMDVLETAPEAAGAIKAANTRFKREMALEDINDWLKPGHGVISSRRGVDTIKPDALLNKFNKELADSKLFRDSFTPEEVATMQDNMRALAAKTLPPPGPRAPVPPRPDLLPGASAPPQPAAAALPGAVDDRFTKGLAEAPAPTPLPERPELAAPPKEVKPVPPLTVPLTPPAKVPTEPASTSMWYPEPLKKGEWIRKAPPKEGQWTREQWDTFAKEATKKQPRLWRELAGAGMAGGLAYGLQRMGLSPAAANMALWGVGGGIATSAVKGKLNWFLSKAMLSDKYRPLLQEAMMDNQQINPYFSNAMLAALTPEDRKEYERVQRSEQKARR